MVSLKDNCCSIDLSYASVQGIDLLHNTAQSRVGNATI